MTNDDKRKEMIRIAECHGIGTNEDGEIKYRYEHDTFRFVFENDTIRFDVNDGNDFWITLKSWNLDNVNLDNWDDTMMRTAKFGTILS